MAIQSFSFTLSGSGKRSVGDTVEPLAYALCVRRSSGKEEVVTTFTVSSAQSGVIRQSVSFGIGGKGVFPTPAQLAPLVPRELADMWQSILPRLAEFVHQTGLELDRQHRKGS